MSFNVISITRACNFDLLITGQTAIIRQKIAEAGMAANQVPGEIDFAIVPDVSMYDDSMNVDPHLEEWEDVVEEDLDAEGQTVGQMMMQRARLQTIITCVFISFLSLSLVAFLIVL